MTDTVIGHQIGLAVLTSFIIQMVKRLSFIPWINKDSVALIRVLSALVSAAAAYGFTLSVNGSFVSGGHIIIAFPSLVQAADFLTHFASQIGLNEGAYRGVKQWLASEPSPVPNPPVPVPPEAPPVH